MKTTLYTLSILIVFTFFHNNCYSQLIVAESEYSENFIYTRKNKKIEIKGINSMNFSGNLRYMDVNGKMKNIGTPKIMYVILNDNLMLYRKKWGFTPTVMYSEKYILVYDKNSRDKLILYDRKIGLDKQKGSKNPIISILVLSFNKKGKGKAYEFFNKYFPTCPDMFKKIWPGLQEKKFLNYLYNCGKSHNLFDEYLKKAKLHKVDIK